MRDRTIMVNGFSKVFAMTGWRVGFVACHRKFIPAILKVHQYATTCIPGFIQEGLAEGMETEACTEAVDHMISCFEERRDFVASELDKIQKLSYVDSMGAFYFFINVSKQEWMEMNLRKSFWKKGGGIGSGTGLWRSLW